MKQAYQLSDYTYRITSQIILEVSSRLPDQVGSDQVGLGLAGYISRYLYPIFTSYYHHKQYSHGCTSPTIGLLSPSPTPTTAAAEHPYRVYRRPMISLQYQAVYLAADSAQAAHHSHYHNNNNNAHIIVQRIPPPLLIPLDGVHCNTQFDNQVDQMLLVMYKPDTTYD